MLHIVLARLLSALPNLAGVVVITFILTRALPGDPAAYFAGAAATQEAIAQVRTQLGLDKPLLEQFFLYVAGLARGDMGLSLTTGQPVAQELIARLPASLELVFLSLLLACAIALPLGVLAATRPGSWIDQLCRLVTTAGVSLPTFFTGLLLAYVFYFLLGWAPSPMGRLDPMFSPPPTITGLYLIDAALAGDAAMWWASLKQLILPVLTMAIFVLAPIARMTRASMLSVLSADFIRTARASGLSAPPCSSPTRCAMRCCRW
jgi:peptide/nickel transport system permease protein